MHELSVVHAIAEACGERAAGAQVLCVTVEVGTLSCVLPDALRFCWELAVPGTALEGAGLEIVRITGRSGCRDCGRVVAMDDPLTVCACGSGNLEPPEGGDQLSIRSMEIEEAA